MSSTVTVNVIGCKIIDDIEDINSFIAQEPDNSILDIIESGYNRTDFIGSVLTVVGEDGPEEKPMSVSEIVEKRELPIVQFVGDRMYQDVLVNVIIDKQGSQWLVMKDEYWEDGII